MTINIYLNDEIQKILPGQSLQDVLVRHKICDIHFAVAVNNQFIPKKAYSTTLLEEGNKVDILVPMQGG